MMMMSSSNNGGESSGSSASSTGGGEFEIAKVLASLRKHDNVTAAVEVEEEMRGSSSGGGRGGEWVGQGGNNNKKSWGSKGKRWISSSGSNKRVKECSIYSSSPSLSPLPFDLNVDQPTLFQEECQNVDVKDEEIGESAERGRVCNSPHNGGRSRHNLTEVFDRGQDIMAEKEARRIRRILANRESARQTIRRRQAFREELTRKAADLASENETLRRSKEMAVKEFQSLQTTNQNLKGQLSQTLGFKLGENKGEAQSSCPDTHNLHSANWAQLMYKKLSAGSFVFPACVSPSDLNVSNLSQQFYSPRMSSEQENTSSINGQNMPWCILPCPVFLPIPDIKNFPSVLLKDRDENSSVDSKNVHSPSSVIRCLHSCPLVRPSDKISMGLPSTQEDCINDYHQIPFGFSLDGGSQQIVPQLPCCWRGRFSVDREDCIIPSTLNNTDISSAKGVETASALPEKRKERTLRKRESTVAGAEARKKRKELMKLKSRLHIHLLGRENS